MNRKDFLKANPIKSLYFVVFYSIYVYTAFTIAYFFEILVVLSIIILLLTAITRTNAYASAISGAAAFTLLFLIEASTLHAYAAVFSINAEQLVQNPGARLQVAVAARAIETLLVFVLYILRIRSPLRPGFSKAASSPLTYVIMQGFTFVIIIVTYFFYEDGVRDSGQEGLLLSLISMIYLVLIFMDYRDKERLMKMRNTKGRLEYARNMESMVNVMRREKHEYINHLNVILAICETESDDAAKRVEGYIKQIMGDSLSTYRFYDSGNSFIDGLLAVKSHYAYQKGISLDADFDSRFDLIEINDAELTSIAGNMVDNAFEAVVQSGRGDGVISIYTYVKGGRFYLSVCDNGIKIRNEYIHKIFNERFTTKKRDSCEHGYGLYITKELVEKNKGSIRVTSTEEATEFLVEFPLKSGAKA